MATIQNAIQFLGFNVTNVVLERPTGFISGEFTINIEHIYQINSNDPNMFQVVFIITIADKEKVFNLLVKAISDFKVIGDVQKEIYDSLVKVNAPAIAYPYLRAFVSNMVLQSGMAPIIIPPVNFTKVMGKETAGEPKSPVINE